MSASNHRYRWAFIPEASDDSGLEVRRQGTHQREFKPYVVRLAKLLRKRAKVDQLSFVPANVCPPPLTLRCCFFNKLLISLEKPRRGHPSNPVMGAGSPDADTLHDPQHGAVATLLQHALSGF